MRRLLIANFVSMLSATLIASAAQASSAPPPIPTLTTPAATSYVRTALLLFKDSFSGGHAKKIRCDTRITPNSVRCKVGWVHGHSTFSGKARTWLNYPPGGGTNLQATWFLSILRVNHSCHKTRALSCTMVCLANGGQAVGVGEPYLRISCFPCLLPGGQANAPCSKAAASESTLDPLRRVPASPAREQHLRFSG